MNLKRWFSPMSNYRDWCISVTIAAAAFLCGVVASGRNGWLGVLVGLVVPALCFAIIACFYKLAVAFIAAIPVGFFAPLLSPESAENNINLMPVFLPLALLASSLVGLLFRLFLEGLRDRKRST